MSGPRPDGQWPEWARYAVLGGLAAIVVVGLVLAATGGHVEGAVVRIVIAGIVIPALLAPVRLLGLRHRGDRTRERLFDELGEVEALLERERSIPLPQRPSGVSDAELTRVADWVRSTREQVSSPAPSADVRASVDQLGELTRDWPESSPPAAAIASCRTRARSLASLSRSVGRP